MPWSLRYRADSSKLRLVKQRIFSLAARNCSNSTSEREGRLQQEQDQQQQRQTRDVDQQQRVAEPLVLEQTHGDVALIGLNRPDVRNCVNSQTAIALRAAFERFEADAGLKTAILHGVGGNFCAGYDLKELARGGAEDTVGVDNDDDDGNNNNNRSDNDVGVDGGDDHDDSERPSLAATMERRADEDPLFRPMGPSKMFLSKPLIGSISGYAVAGGLELALLCDVRILDENAIFGVFCRRFGVPLIDCGTVRLAAVVGYGRAMEMILSGRPVGAKEALAWGLANEVVETGTALGKALSFARSLSKFPFSCLLADRRSLFYSTFEAGSFAEAADAEFRRGLPILDAEAKRGAGKFAGGEKIGRRGSFDLDKIKDYKQYRIHKP